MDRPYASWRARYDTPTRWRYWRSKYDPYYDPLTDPLALDYRRDALLPPPPRVPADWSWQLDEVTWAGRRLLLDAATGLVYEEANPGAMVWSVGRLALGQVGVAAALATLALQSPIRGEVLWRQSCEDSYHSRVGAHRVPGLRFRTR